jgi:hypothetical protein
VWVSWKQARRKPFLFRGINDCVFPLFSGRCGGSRFDICARAWALAVSWRPSSHFCYRRKWNYIYTCPWEVCHFESKDRHGEFCALRHNVSFWACCTVAVFVLPKACRVLSLWAKVAAATVVCCAPVVIPTPLSSSCFLDRSRLFSASVAAGLLQRTEVGCCVCHRCSQARGTFTAIRLTSLVLAGWIPPSPSV